MHKHPFAQWSYRLSWAVKNEASRSWFGCLNEINLACTYCVDSNFNSSLRKASVYCIILLHFMPPTLYLHKKTLFNGLWRSAELFLNAFNILVLNFLKQNQISRPGQALTCFTRRRKTHWIQGDCLHWELGLDHACRVQGLGKRRLVLIFKNSSEFIN